MSADKSGLDRFMAWNSGKASACAPFATRTDLSQAAVAAALEGAAAALQNVADNWDCGHNESRLCDCGPYVEQWGLAADEIRALITDPQRDSLQAVIDAAKAEAQLEALYWLAAGCYPEETNRCAREIRAIISTATTAPSDKIAEAARAAHEPPWDCEGCAGGDKWPVTEEVWRCPVCDTEYSDNGGDPL